MTVSLKHPVDKLPTSVAATCCCWRQRGQKKKTSTSGNNIWICLGITALAAAPQKNRWASPSREGKSSRVANSPPPAIIPWTSAPQERTLINLIRRSLDTRNRPPRFLLINLITIIPQGRNLRLNENRRFHPH
jgi:hypothetical protein